MPGLADCISVSRHVRLLWKESPQMMTVLSSPPKSTRFTVARLSIVAAQSQPACLHRDALLSASGLSISLHAATGRNPENEFAGCFRWNQCCRRPSRSPAAECCCGITAAALLDCSASSGRLRRKRRKQETPRSPLEADFAAPDGTGSECAVTATDGAAAAGLPPLPKPPLPPSFPPKNRRFLSGPAISTEAFVPSFLSCGSLTMP